MNSSSAFAVEVPDSLLAAVRSGDLAAFERLYRLFERPVFQLAARMCGDRDEAMDVLQETFLKVRSGLDGFRGDAPFWGWLRRIAVNETLMHLRRRNGRPEVDTLDDHEPSAPPEQAPQRQVESAELERALARLPALTRGVLWLYHVEGYTHPEIAALTGRTVSFSKSQLARGSERLRRAMDDRVSPAIPHTLEARHVG